MTALNGVQIAIPHTTPDSFVPCVCLSQLVLSHPFIFHV